MAEQGQSMLQYDEVITSSGIKIPFVPAIITPKVEQPLRNNRYEGGQCAFLRRILQAGDRVLELGSGVGFLSSVAGLAEGVASVTTVEANPNLLPIIKETHQLNGVTNVKVINRVVAADEGPDVEFFSRSDFWASSSHKDRRPYDAKFSLPGISLGSLIADEKPTILVCGLSGGEFGLLDTVDLSGLRAIIIEVHPRLYGEAGVSKILGGLAAKGMILSPRTVTGSKVLLLERAAMNETAHPFPARGFRNWPIQNPKVFIATCMKDEGPFILEWVAWHRSMGVTDITVFTNDCSDGTDLLLDRLDELGLVQHLPNPAFIAASTAFQPLALAYAHQLPAMREADFFISMDVDEFINVRCGDHTLDALFYQTGAFDVLSMSEVNHGCNNHEHYERGWLTELFPAHQTTTPGKFRARRGVKSIVRLSDRVEKLRNHRPDMRDDLGPILWLNGAGRVTPHFMADRGENGHDSRRSFDLVRLEHFPLRSLDSYLAKMYRGDVVVTGKQVSRTYWRTRNKHDENSTGYAAQLKRAKAWHAKHMGKDKILMALHEAACAAHAAKIAELVHDPVFSERREWVLNEAWASDPESEAAE